jgi:phosphatidylinositol glycan class B
VKRKFMIEETPLLLLLRKNKYILTAFSIVFVTALFSSGFLHPDEHYQILELLFVKLNGSIVDPSIFNWDFHLKIRSWIQPFIYFLLSYPLKVLNGFQLATMIRLFNGVIGLYGIYKFIGVLDVAESEQEHITHPVSKEKHLKSLALVLCVWFVPLLLVRTNSESLSTSLFFIGYYFYEKKRRPFSMLFLSLSFLVRYQMALVICPLILMDLFKRKICPFTLIKMTACFLFMISIGALVDYWGYGSWSLTPYNYFFQNLVEDKASNFGTSPFYYYFTKPLLKGIPPISLFVGYFGLIGLWRRRTASLSWAIVCFVIVHSLIPHKEVRFLNFTYILFAVYAAIEFLTYRYSMKKLLVTFLVLNLLVMAKTSTFPAHSRISLYKEVFDKKYTSLYTPPKAAQFRFTMPFYMNRNIKTIEISQAIKDSQSSYNLLTSTYDEYKEYSENVHCKTQYSQYPSWIESLNYFGWLKRSSFHAIWKCHSLKN